MAPHKKILVVDDEASFRELLRDFFRKAGIDVLPASNGEEALEILRENPPDLILLDLQMPKMDGIAFYNRISQATGKPKCPVIVLTGRSNYEKIFRGIQVEAFVTKPVRLEELLLKVRSILFPRLADPNFPKATAKGKKILVVENDKEKFDALVGELTAYGFLVCGVKGGLEAIARAPKENPDVVVCKLALTDVFGDMLAVQLKQVLGAPVKIVVYSHVDQAVDEVLIEKICENASIFRLVKSDDAKKVADAVAAIYEN